MRCEYRDCLQTPPKSEKNSGSCFDCAYFHPAWFASFPNAIHSLYFRKSRAHNPKDFTVAPASRSHLQAMHTILNPTIDVRFFQNVHQFRFV